MTRIHQDPIAATATAARRRVAEICHRRNLWLDPVREEWIRLGTGPIDAAGRYKGPLVILKQDGSLLVDSFHIDVWCDLNDRDEEIELIPYAKPIPIEPVAGSKSSSQIAKPAKIKLATVPQRKSEVKFTPAAPAAPPATLEEIQSLITALTQYERITAAALARSLSYNSIYVSPSIWESRSGLSPETRASITRKLRAEFKKITTLPDPPMDYQNALRRLEALEISNPSLS